MRQLSEAEVAHEVAQIEARDWPWFPFLPVKRLGAANDEDRIGVVTDQEPAKVYLCNLSEVSRLQDGDVRTIEFESVEDMVRANWVGD